MSGDRRVVVSGLGVVSPLGLGIEPFWSALCSGRAAFRPIRSFDASAYRTNVAAELPDSWERSCYAFALAAARQALEDARLKPGPRVGLALGTTAGEELALERAIAQTRSRPAALRREAEAHAPGRIPARVAAELGLGGPNALLANACAAGNYALAYGLEKLASGRADAMLVGGVDLISPVLCAGFNRLLAIAPELCRPFSKGRKGLIPGEGACVLILERAASAASRGRKAYAEILGYGLSSDAHHVTMPHADGVRRAIEGCLTDAGLSPESVDYINAHGTGTPANDRIESAAIKAAFGARAAKVPISSIKSMLGHAMGAASAFEAAACCLVLERGQIPPTINHVPGDPDCDLDYVPDQARRGEFKTVLSNAFAFGGSNSVVAFGRPGSAAAAKPAPSRLIVVTAAARVDEKDPVALAESLLKDKDIGFLDRPMATALCGVKRALDAAKLDPAGTSVGIVLDSSGEIESLARFYDDLLDSGPGAVEPRLFPNILANAASSRAAIAFGLKRVNLSLGGSFPGGELALSCAIDQLRRDPKGVLIAGALDEDGGRFFVLETRESARARGAGPLAEIEVLSESFGEPGAPTSCDCLMKAVSAVAESGTARGFIGRGRWGGRIELAIRPVAR